MENISKFKSHLYKFLSLFRKGDFKIRYILALSLIALLSLAQQVIVQINLDSQISGFTFIQSSREQIGKLNELKLKLLDVQAYTDLNKARPEFLEILFDLSQFIKKESTNWNQKINETDIELALAREKISNVIRQSEAIQNDNNSETISVNAIELASQIELYEKSVVKKLDIYDQAFKRSIKRFRIYELLILMVTLLTLLFEALYIFSPALKKLDAALLARSNFLSRIGHEIRNPMNSILGMADLLEKQYQNSSQLLYLQRLRKSAIGLLGFLNNVIDYAGIENKKSPVLLSSIDLTQLIEEISSLFFLDAASKGLKFYFSLDKDVPGVVESDLIKLKYILINLLSNAIKFTHSGSINVFFTFKNNIITIQVKDSGIGIVESKQSAIFNEFVQEDSSTQRRYGGTGLGLAIVQEYVHQLNGIIKLDSTKGIGSTFTISVPVRAHSKSINFDPTFSTAIIFYDEELFAWMKFHFSNKNLKFVNDHYDEILIQDTSLDQQTIYLFNCDSKIPSHLENNVYVIQLAPTNSNLQTQYVFPLLPWSLNHYSISEPTLVKTKFVQKILICDDSLDNREILVTHLSDYFSDIEEVSSGEDCLELLKKKSFALIFLDIQMPGIDGFQVIEEAKNIPGIKSQFIAFTAHNTEIEVEKMKKHGFTYILNKPIIHTSLMNLITNLKLNRPEEIETFKNDFEARVKDRILRKKHHFITDKLHTLKLIDEKNSEIYFQQAQTLGHNLKGTGAAYGLDNLSILGNDIETFAKNFDREKLAANLIQLENELHKEL